MPYKLSPSSLNLMQECSRCFWLDKHDTWKRPSGAFPSLPSGMDKILKTHFDKFMKQGKMPPELCNSKECKNLKLFDEENLLSVWRSNFKGLSWTDENGNIIHGAVDNILINKKNEKLIVLDYKTRGFPLKEDTAEHYQLQLDIYTFLLKQNDYETEDFAYLLFYVPKEVNKTGEVLFDTKLVKMNVSAERGEKAFKEALKFLKNNDYPVDYSQFTDKEKIILKQLLTKINLNQENEVSLKHRLREIIILKRNVNYFIQKKVLRSVIPISEIPEELVKIIKIFNQNYADAKVIASAIQEHQTNHLIAFTLDKKDWKLNSIREKIEALKYDCPEVRFLR